MRAVGGRDPPLAGHTVVTARFSSYFCAVGAGAREGGWLAYREVAGRRQTSAWRLAPWLGITAALAPPIAVPLAARATEVEVPRARGGPDVASEPGLRVETGSPDALCPDLAQTRAAVGRRLGRIEAAAGAGWVARYTVAHAPRGTPRDFVRLELFAPDGGRELSKDLPIEGSCATLADVIALVLDRHFRGLAPTEPAPERSTVGRDLWRSLAPGAAADSRSRSPGALASRQLSPDRGLPTDPHWDLPPSEVAGSAAVLTTQRLAFTGFELGTEWNGGPSVALRALAEWQPQLYFGVALSLGLTRTRQPLGESGALGGVGGAAPEALAGAQGAEVVSRSLTLDAYGGWGPKLGPVWLYIGPGARVTLDAGSARGLPQSNVGERAVFGAGVHAGVVWSLAPSFVVNLSGVFDRSLSPLSGRFEVDGVEVLEPPTHRAAVGLGVGYALSP